jgi:hypothetical protein
MTIKNFQDIHDKKLPLKTKNKEGKEVEWWPRPNPSTCETISVSLNHNDIYVIDVDGDLEGNKKFQWVNIPEIFRHLPYSESRNKRLPHFLF